MKFVRVCALGLGLGLSCAAADALYLGAGEWSCGDVLQIHQTGTPAQQGELTGWILGFWSAATLERDASFVDTVETVGGLRIAELTLEQCRKVPSNTPLWTVATVMISNTK